MADAARDSFGLTLADEQATLALGAWLALRLKPGDFLALQGGLGAGKTTLARGLVRAWMQEPEAEVPSPTFTLAQIYDGPRGRLWHMDLYRLKAPEEALELGLEDALVEGVCVVEWPERLGALLPASRIDLALSGEGDGRRAALRCMGAMAGRGEEFAFDTG